MAMTRGTTITLVGFVFVIGLGIGVAERLATLPENDTSWLGTVREAWVNMYGSMGGAARMGTIEYFVYHPEVARDHVKRYVATEPRVQALGETLYDSASVLTIKREDRDVLPVIEGQSWVRFAIRGELMFFCH